jgi:hypothetical protein
VPADDTARVRALLYALADLSPSAEQPDTAGTVPLDWFRWLPVSAGELVAPPIPAQERVGGVVTRARIERELAERLAAVDQVRPLQHALRVGWLFVAGRTGTGAGSRRVLHPLVTVPVRARHGLLVGGGELMPAGDPELSPLIPDGPERHALEASIEYGGGGLLGVDVVGLSESMLARLPKLQAFARAAAEAAGFHVRRIVAAGDPPEAYLRRDLAIVVGAAVYAVHETGGLARDASLRAWAERVDDEPTALHTMYLGTGVPAREPREAAPESPFLLAAAQRRAVEASRTAPLGVVSGAPGTGKSQTVVAIACDALARGETVLVAAKSDATVDALLDLLDRSPGPMPVVFGSSERRLALAQRLAGGIEETPRHYVADAQRRLTEAVRHREAVRATLVGAVRAHALTAGDPALAALRDSAPALFVPGAPVATVEELLRRNASGGFWAGRRLRRALALAGAAPGTDPATVLDAAALARAVAAAGPTTPGGALPPTPDYPALLAAEDAVRDAAGHWIGLAARSDERLDPRARGSVAALATALRSGRAARRTQLSRLDRPLARALPLWVGSLPDIDDLLPQVPGLFDLVVLDEASSIDQPLAAPALLRARRAVVVGDPRQLRHVSFLGDKTLAEVLARYEIDDDPVVAAKLDVRRNSTFDVAASAAPVVTLDEHFRSRPHLVEYVARAVYGGAFAVARRNPDTEVVDCIEVECVPGRRGKDGAVAAEVARAIDLVRERHAAGRRSVGVVTPFRAQADALEAAVLAAFGADELHALNLRVGTVHAFQGNERDDVIVSVGVGPDENATTWRFVDDPHLFAVLTTRARTATTLLRSADPPPRGLLAGYLAQADEPPGRPPNGGVAPWAAALADDLRAAGVDLVTAYPAGRHVVDVAVYGTTPVAVVAGVHPEGADAHVDRAVALLRNGWRVVEALPRPYLASTEAVVVELLGRL